MSDRKLGYEITLKERASAVLTRLRGVLATFGRGIGGLFSPILALPAMVGRVMGSIARNLVRLPALIGGTAIGAAVSKSVAAFGRQEQATLSLAGALRIAGDASDDTLRRLVAYSEGLQKITTYGDEAIQAAMALGLNLGVPKDRIEEVTKAAIGLAERTGMDLATAMQLFGRTASGASGQLSRYGIVIDENATHQERLNQLIAAGAGYFGLAEDKARSSAGRFAQLKNSIGDLWERVGEAIERVFGLSSAFQRLRERIDNVGTDRLATALARVRAVSQAVGNIFTWLRERIAAIAQSEAVQGFVSRLVQGFGVLVGIVKQLVDGTTTFGAVLGQIGTLLGDSLKLGFTSAVNLFSRHVTAVLRTLPTYVREIFGAVTSGEYWAGLAQVVIGSLTSVGAYLIKIFTAPLTLLQAGMDTIMQGFVNWLAGLGGKRDADGVGRLGRYLGLGIQDVDFDKNLKRARSEGRFSRIAEESEAGGRDMLKSGLAKVDAAWRPAMRNVHDEYQRAFADAEGPFDADAIRGNVEAALRGLKEKYGVEFKMPEVHVPDYVAPRSTVGPQAGAAGGSITDAAAEYRKKLAAMDTERIRADVGVLDRFDWKSDVAAGRSPDEQIAANTERMKELLEKIAEAEGVK